MRKEQALTHWRKLPSATVLDPQMVMYKHEGSTYGEDSIRITGQPAFIDAVLGRIKDLLEHENNNTRLQLSYTPIKAKPGNDPPAGSHACYIQVHERGPQSQMLNAFVDGCRAKVAAR